MTNLTPNSLRDAFVARIDELAPPDYDASLFAATCEKIRQHLVPVVAGWRVERSHVIGASKIGGSPDLPKEFPWPTNRSGTARLSFLLQINLAELSAATSGDETLGFPRTGMFYLFALCDADAAQAYIMDSAYTAVRFIAQPGSLTPRLHPDDVTAHARVDEMALQLVVCVRVSPLQVADHFGQGGDGGRGCA